MTLETAVYSAAVVFVAYLVRGIAGFGSGLIAVPLLTLISPVTAVVPVVVSLDYIGSASHSVRNLDDIAWREQVVLLPFMLIGILGGLYLLTVVPTWVLAKTLGVFVIAFGIYQLLPLPAGARLAHRRHVLRHPGRAARHAVRHRRSLLRDLPELARARSDRLPGHLRAELPDRRRGPPHRLRRPGPPPPRDPAAHRGGGAHRRRGPLCRRADPDRA